MTLTRKTSETCLRLLKKALTLFVCAGVFIIVHPVTEAYAGCSPGVPCVQPKTPNSPTTLSDGPTAPGAPNQPKVTNGKTCDGNNPAPGCACDADLMNQMYMRAWLESQRLTIKAETLLRKPDSILEYTCFDELSNIAGTKAPRIFSENQRWMNHNVSINGKINITPIPYVTMSTGIPPGTLQSPLLNQIIIQSLTQYISLNFPHKFLGGAAKTLDWKPGSASYDCKYMDEVYFLSKCSDIVTDDRFWTFKELISPDPRLLPIPCTKGTKITQEKIDVAENKGFAYVNTDSIKPAYVDLFDPNASCAKPVPTGLIVIDKHRSRDAIGNVTVTNVRTYEDKVCPTPNCYYTGEECKK